MQGGYYPNKKRKHFCVGTVVGRFLARQNLIAGKKRKMENGSLSKLDKDSNPSRLGQKTNIGFSRSKGANRYLTSQQSFGKQVASGHSLIGSSPISWQAKKFEDSVKNAVARAKMATLPLSI